MNVARSTVLLTASLLMVDATHVWSQDSHAPPFTNTCPACEIEPQCDCRLAEPQLRVSFGIPLWLPEIHGTATVRRLRAPVHVSTREVFGLIGDIDNFFFGRLDVNYGPWGAFADGVYGDVPVSRDVLRRIDLTAGFRAAIVDFGVSYDFAQSVGGLESSKDWNAKLIVGGRYNLLEATAITITGPRGRSLGTSGKRDWVDPIIGGHLRAPLAQNLHASFRGDIGGFGIGSASHFTWNIEALFEIQCSECLQLMLGYRLLDIDQRRGSGNERFRWDVQFKGPIARAVLEF